MKALKFIYPFAFGLVGGFCAIAGVSLMNGENGESEIHHEVVGPSIIRPAIYAPKTDKAAGQYVDLRNAAQKAVSAVVNVTPVQMERVYYGTPLDFWFGVSSGKVKEEPIDMGIGSGVIITEDGYIITNNHVIENSDKIMVTLNDRRKFEAELVGTDPNTDIALLKINADGLQAIEYGNSDEVELGEWVLAVGNPYNLTSTVTAGIISAKARALGSRMNLESFLQTDAAVNPGNSGGALVNMAGQLIGINTAIQSPTGSYSGYSFAVPVNVARKVVGDLKNFGKVQRVVLGIKMVELTAEVSKSLDIDDVTGVYVAEVVHNGAADKAGLKEGDVIHAMNGYDVKTAAQLQEQLAKYTPGDVVELDYTRSGRRHTVKITLQNTLGSTTISSDDDFLGAKFSPLSREERNRYRLNMGVKIQKLKNGEFKSAGLSEGDIIVKINNHPITSVDELQKAIEIIGNEGILVTAITRKGRLEHFALSLKD